VKASRLAVLVLWLCLPLTAISQVNNEQYQGLFLVGEFGEICTMCEATVYCARTDTIPVIDAIPADGTFTIYHLQTRSFWSQIATIWEWFIAMVDSQSLAQGHDRPVHVYRITDGNWQGPEVIEGHIALSPPVLSFGVGEIDRASQEWLAMDSKRHMGYCTRLPLWDTLEAIDKQTTENHDD